MRPGPLSGARCSAYAFESKCECDKLDLYGKRIGKRFIVSPKALPEQPDRDKRQRNNGERLMMTENRNCMGAVAGVAMLAGAQPPCALDEITVAYFLEWPMPFQYAKADGHL